MTQLTNNLPSVTEWFDGKTTVPGQPGVYERCSKKVNGVSSQYAYWDGKVWGMGWTTVELAIWHRTKSVFQNLPWRGLTEEVKS